MEGYFELLLKLSAIIEAETGVNTLPGLIQLVGAQKLKCHILSNTVVSSVSSRCNKIGDIIKLIKDLNMPLIEQVMQRPDISCLLTYFN